MLQKTFYKQNTLPDLISSEKLPPTPERIGPYKIEGLLSKGGMSLLYLGIHPETNQTLVVKVLSPGYINHPEATAHFLKEAHIIGITSHPNIVKLYGQGEWEGGLYIAMEFIRGVSLSQFIAQQSFSLKRCIDIILQVSYALCHLHANGVVHRDLKPENILMSEDGEIKVIDFGIAQLHEETRGSIPHSKVLGTPSYMSPEQKEDPSKATYASDIYSLAVIAYELVLGKLSYGMMNLSLLPKGFQRIIGKALAVSLSERYNDIVDLISDLSDYLKSGELEKERPGSDEVKEVLETLQKAGSMLVPGSPPDWPEFEIGLAKHKGPGQMGIYFDFFKLPDNNYLILLAEPTTFGIEAPIYIASLRGMIRTLIHEREPATRAPFQVRSFISALNELIHDDSLKQPFSLALLLLDPLQEELTYLSCGLGRLVHLPEGSELPRYIAVPNPPLGVEMPGDFTETNDNWKIGDTLFLHSLETALHEDDAQKREFEGHLNLAIKESALLSAERQAETILRKMTSLHAIATESLPKVLLSIRRLS
ncbi:MAG: protein kinase [Chlamydiales bacterium]|nr:protein kinase [Chlamydiales bacterium]